MKLLSAMRFLIRSSHYLLAKTTDMSNRVKAAMEVRFTHIHIEDDNKILTHALQMSALK